MTALLMLLLSVPISLDAISVDRARALDGRLVVAEFLVAKAGYTVLGATVVGAADRDDGVERTAVLVGNRLDVDEGKRVVVVGYLAVIDHRPEIRIEQ